MRHEKDRIQIACVNWFSLQYPNLALLLHHSPNGGKRTRFEAIEFKRMGTRRGFPDLILCFPSRGHHALFVEMKTKIGRQQPSQKIMQRQLEWAGYKYVICRSLEDFINEINDYLR